MACGCEETKKRQELGVIERTARRMAQNKAKETGKTVIYVIYVCESGAYDFMLEDAWEKALADGKKYAFVKYVSSF
jgi:hypothetical protein